MGSQLGLAAFATALLIAAAALTGIGAETESEDGAFTLSGGSMFISDAGRSHGGFEMNVGYTLSFDGGPSAVYRQGQLAHVRVVFEIGLGDPVGVRDLYVRVTVSEADGELCLFGSGTEIVLVYEESDSVWGHEFDGYHIASWGGYAPPEEIRGEISPEDFGLPPHYYVEMRMMVTPA